MITRAWASDQKLFDVEAFVGDAGVERLDVAVAPRLPGRDEVQPDLASCPVGHW